MPLFVTIEGGEGAGKTTLVRALEAKLLGCGVDAPVCATFEPGGTEIGRALRQALLDTPWSLQPWTETLLFLADRSEDVERVIRPALDAGSVVLSDRFLDSTLAYQGYGRGLELDLLRRLNDAVTGGLSPDLTLLLDLPPELGLARTRARSGGASEGDRIGDAALAFHQRVNAGFRELAAAEPQRIRIIDATQSAEHVLRDVWSLVEPFARRA